MFFFLIERKKQNQGAVKTFWVVEEMKLRTQQKEEQMHICVIDFSVYPIKGNV